MKKFFSAIGKLFSRKRKSDSKIIEPQAASTIEKTVRLTDEFEINVKGIPTNLTPVEQKQIFISLLRNGLNLSKERAYQKGDNVFRGNASLNIKDKIYHLEYSISAMKVLQALSVYKEAFEYVNQGADSGKFDLELAEMAADFLKESAWQEILGMPKPNQKGFSNTIPAENSKQISADKSITEKERENGNE
ncbi:MAG: hypothetical protein D6732_10375 [Methanobacteriota archaeon]|nr:MAG: hypothetical protein D6732_10375 [Euryarchaeota archaeon]